MYSSSGLRQGPSQPPSPRGNSPGMLQYRDDQSTVNPADLVSNAPFSSDAFDEACQNYIYNKVDSAIDLASFPDTSFSILPPSWPSPNPNPTPAQMSTHVAACFEFGGSSGSSTPSPDADHFAFSSANSPGADFPQASFQDSSRPPRAHSPDDEYLQDQDHYSNCPPRDNSPGDEFLQDQDRYSNGRACANSPPEYRRDEAARAASPPEFLHIQDQDQDASPLAYPDSAWDMCYETDAVVVPHTPASTPRELVKVFLTSDKTKTRAETQIKTQLTLDPMDEDVQWISFPTKTLAKPKHICTADEKKECEKSGKIVYMDLMLVCATAIESPERHEQALRRARGDEEIPSRPEGLALSELDKDDPAHPQNGGEVLICHGCKERERKRYDRKKKKADDEIEWAAYEDQRVIMINDKQFKKWKDVDSTNDPRYSSRAKQVEFNMRIACYCRHQEEKAPVGYRVIFTFKDDRGSLIAQHVSGIFQITDDHKNKDAAPDMQPRAGSINQYMAPPFAPTSLMPSYPFPQHPQHVQHAQHPPHQHHRHPHHPQHLQLPQHPQHSQHHHPMGGLFSQPSTPTLPVFSNGMTHMDAQFPQPAPQPFPAPSAPVPNHGITRAASFSGYGVPLVATNSQLTAEVVEYLMQQQRQQRRMGSR